MTATRRLLRIARETVELLDATAYVGLDNLDTAAAVERDFQCTERRDMALARMLASSGEIRYGGERIDGLASHRLIHRGLALVPEAVTAAVPLTASAEASAGAAAALALANFSPAG